MNKEKVKKFFKDNGPTMLMAAGCAGTVVTAVLGINAGTKIAKIMDKQEDEKLTKEDKIAVVKACVPAVISCGASIGCNVGADILNRKAKNDLIAMCALVGSSYSGYRSEVIKRYGKEVDSDIIDTVNERCDLCYMAPEVPDKLSKWIIDMGDYNIPEYTIEAYERDVINAEKHLNRNYILGWSASVTNLLEFLDVPKFDAEITDKYGWALDDSEIYFIDFEHRKIDDNTFKLFPVFTPWKNFWECDCLGEKYE